MTESSNYDGSPPGPPAYGVWKKIGARQFEARDEVLLTKSTKPLEEIAKDGGWLPDGHGVLAEEISLSADGKTFTSRVRWDMFDRGGKAVESGIEGTGEGRRMGFSWAKDWVGVASGPTGKCIKTQALTRLSGRKRSESPTGAGVWLALNGFGSLEPRSSPAISNPVLSGEKSVVAWTKRNSRFLTSFNSSYSKIIDAGPSEFVTPFLR